MSANTSVRKKITLVLIVALCYALVFCIMTFAPGNQSTGVAEAPQQVTTATLNFSDGAIYSGDVYAGTIRQGEGSYVWATGESYVGEWRDDMISGSGKLVWPGLGQYEGTFINGKRQGTGTFTWTYVGDPEEGKPVQYSGKWENDKIGSNGTLVIADIGTYNGDFKNQMRSGNGTFTWENGDQYKGEWSNDSITGDGTLTLSDGTILKGKFTKGLLTKGTVTYKVDGGTAVRDVNAGKAGNAVTITYSDKTVLKGTTSKTGFTGKVTITYGATGDTYVGILKDGLKNGQGTYTWRSGAHYVGNWVNDKMEGTGKYYYSKDETKNYLSGKFSNGVPTGTVSYVSEKKIKYETTWRNGECTNIVYKK